MLHKIFALLPRAFLLLRATCAFATRYFKGVYNPDLIAADIQQVLVRIDVRGTSPLNRTVLERCIRSVLCQTYPTKILQVVGVSSGYLAGLQSEATISGVGTIDYVSTPSIPTSTSYILDVAPGAYLPSGLLAGLWAEGPPSAPVLVRSAPSNTASTAGSVLELWLRMSGAPQVPAARLWKNDEKSDKNEIVANATIPNATLNSTGAVWRALVLQHEHAPLNPLVFLNNCAGAAVLLHLLLGSGLPLFFMAMMALVTALGVPGDCKRHWGYHLCAPLYYACAEMVATAAWTAGVWNKWTSR
jgi:hypothetical protein